MPNFIRNILLLLFLLLCNGPASADIAKKRIFVVSSYHPEYLWSQETSQGLCQALLEYKLLDNADQAAEYTKNDYIESSKIIMKKAWMDTKRKDSKSDMANATARIMEDIQRFKPDLVLLGDDNAANYIGNLLIDTDTPIVFWGINGLPLKYGLIDSLEQPGHNVTGVYQSGYLIESVAILQKLVPTIKTLGVLSDDSETGRSKAKEIEQLDSEGKFSVKVTEIIITNSYSEWKAGALRLKDNVDGIFVLNHNTLKDDDGRPIDQMEAGKWYLTNIPKPDCSNSRQFATEGVLIVVNDSGFKQGYEAMQYGYQILYEGKMPSHIPVKAPSQGPVIVNRQRAEMLNIDVTEKKFIEEYIDKAMALEENPDKAVP